MRAYVRVSASRGGDEPGGDGRIKGVREAINHVVVVLELTSFDQLTKLLLGTFQIQIPGCCLILSCR